MRMGVMGTGLVWSCMVMCSAFSQVNETADPAGLTAQEKKTADLAVLTAQEEKAPDLAGLLAQARNSLDALAGEQKFKELPAREAEWAGKIDAALQANPGNTDSGAACLMLANLYGSAPDGGAKLRALYDRIKGSGAGQSWFTEFLRRVFYQLRRKDKETLVSLFTDAETLTADPEARADVLYFHGQLLMDSGDLPGARALFDRLLKEHAQSAVIAATKQAIYEIDVLQPGKPAPDFKIKDMADKEIHLAAFKGKVVLLVFWTHWAPLLAERVPVLTRIAAQQKAGPFVLVGVCLDEARDRALAEKAITDLGMTWRHGFDGQGWDGPTAGLYNAFNLPRAFLIDPKGTLIAKDALYNHKLQQEVNNKVAQRKAALQKAEAEKIKKAAEKKAAAEKAAAEKAAAQKPPAKKPPAPKK